MDLGPNVVRIMSATACGYGCGCGTHQNLILILTLSIANKVMTKPQLRIGYLRSLDISMLDLASRLAFQRVLCEQTFILEKANNRFGILM